MAGIYELQVQDIDGNMVPLKRYAGQVLLIVNVASECGFTPQYADLEKLWQSRRERGLQVLGFPSNDFGAQEPGDEEDIQEFCSTRYRITFPMFAKVRVKGEGKVPLYGELSAEAGEPKWNFHKYLVGRDGSVLGAFGSGVAPLSAELVSAIESALG